MSKPQTRTPPHAAPLEMSAAERTSRPPYGWAAAAFAIAFALYALTLAPSTAFWDASEYIATAHILGIPHPPGNPLFVILGRVWEILLAPLPFSTAVKINLFSATMSAAAAALWFLVAHRVLAFFSESELFRRVGAAAAALLSATAFTVWNQAVVNEKVYAVSLFTTAFLTWLVFRWRDNLGRWKDDNVLVLIVFLLALSIGNHLMGLLAAPAIAVFILLVRRDTALAVLPALVWLILLPLSAVLAYVAAAAAVGAWVLLAGARNVRLLAASALLAVAGLGVQIFLPIRAARDPVINEADPKCESLLDASKSILTNGASEACPALAASLQREQYNKPPITLNPIEARLRFTPGGDVEWAGPPRDLRLIAGQVGMYLQYFNWQWGRALGGSDPVSGAPLRPLLTIVFAVLIGYGAWRHFQHDRTSFVYFFLLFGTVTAGLIFYLNFKYGYTLGSDLPPGWREVRERDYFYLVSFSFSGLWAGIGLAALWQNLAERWRSARRGALDGGLRAAAPVLLLAVLPLLLNAQRASRAGDWAARDWAYNLLNSVEPYGVLFTNGDNDTFPLWYLQEVEGIRRDVIVIVYSYLATDWYPRQLRELSRPCEGRDPLDTPTVIVCQRPFEPETAVAALRDEPAPPPSRSILGWNDEEIRAVPQGQVLSRPSRFTAGEIDTVFPAGTRLLMNDFLVLGIIQQSLGDRPIFFASTTDIYRSLQLDSYLIRHGLAYKLNNGPIEEDTVTLARIPGAIARSDVRWMDLDFTETVLWDQFVYHNLFEREFWPDHSTNGIPAQYYRAHWDVAAAYALQENEEAVTRNLGRAEEFLTLAFGRLPSQPAPAEPAPRGATPSETAAP